MKSSLNASTLYLFNDFSSLPLKQYIKLFILLLSYPHSDSLLEGIDCIESLLTDHEFITDNTHPIYQQFYVFFFIILSYRLFKIN